jgi:hypothetical protein
MASGLKVPLLDLTGVPMLRNVGDLDLSLQAMLASGRLTAHPPGDPPLSVHVSETAVPPSLSWVRHAPSTQGLLGIAGSTAVACAVLATVASPAAWIAPLIGLPFLILAALHDIGHGRQTLVLHPNRLSFTGLLQTREIALDRIEMVREDHRTGTLEFVTDDAIVGVYVPPKAATYVRLRVESWLRDQATT